MHRGPSCSTTASARCRAIRRARCAPALLLCAALLLGPGVAAGEELTVRVVALTGEAAPGTGDGVVFSAFTTPINHAIMSPQIDDRGAVSFIAFLTGPGVDGSNQTGIWRETGGALELVVRKGDPAPGTDPGTVFIGIPNDEVPFPPTVGNDRAGFFGALTGPGVDFGNDGGLWIDDDRVRLLVREGDLVPEANGDVRFGSVGLVGFDDLGGIYGVSMLSGSGVGTANDDTVWAVRDGTFELIAREGNEAPGTDVQFARGEIGTFVVFPQISINGQGRLAMEATLNGSGVNSSNDEAIFLESGETGELELLLREGDPAPGLDPDVTFGGNSVSLQVAGLTINDRGETAFNLRLGGALPTTTAMYSTRGGALTPEVVAGDPAPGTDLDFSVFGAATLSDTGRIAFRAAAEGGFFPPFGVWWDQPGTLSALLLPDDVIDTEVGAQVFLGASFIVGFSDAGELATLSSLEDAVSGEFRSGLLLSDATGEHTLVAATGVPFDVRGDGSDVRDVLRVTQGRLNAAGDLAFRLDFVDGSSGHFVASRADAVGPNLSLTGSCPGSIVLEVDGLTADGTTALAGGRTAGATSIPGGSCAGTSVDLDDALLLTTQSADANGRLTVERQIPLAACGGLIQAIDLVTCETSNVIELP